MSPVALCRPTFAPRRPPTRNPAQTRPPALQARHAPDTAPSRGVLRMASTCSRSPGPTPRDLMISVPCRGLCAGGWQQARKWGALKPTVVGENASPHKLAFFFWCSGTRFTRLPRASREPFSHRPPSGRSRRARHAPRHVRSAGAHRSGRRRGRAGRSSARP